MKLWPTTTMLSPWTLLKVSLWAWVGLERAIIGSKWMTWALTHACLGSFPKYMVCGSNVMKVPLLDIDEPDLLPASSAFTLTVGRMVTASNRTILFIAQYTTTVVWTWLRGVLNSSRGVMTLISMLL